MGLCLDLFHLSKYTLPAPCKQQVLVTESRTPLTSLKLGFFFICGKNFSQIEFCQAY